MYGEVARARRSSVLLAIRAFAACGIQLDPSPAASTIWHNECQCGERAKRVACVCQLPTGCPRPAEQSPILSVEGLTISVRGRGARDDSGRGRLVLARRRATRFAWSASRAAARASRRSRSWACSPSPARWRSAPARSCSRAATCVPCPPRERADLRGDRMTMIFQEPMTSLNPAFTIGDQISEVRRAPPRLDAPRRRARRRSTMLQTRAHPRAREAAGRVSRTSFPAACASAS